MHFCAIIGGRSLWIAAQRVVHGNALTIQTHTERVLRELREQWGLRVLAVVADNAAAYQVPTIEQGSFFCKIKACAWEPCGWQLPQHALELIKSKAEFASIFMLRCAAHSLQLVVQELLELPELQAKRRARGAAEAAGGWQSRLPPSPVVEGVYH